ncbi:hypothetical protein ACM66B_000037 [Microbotryomycetes sp. NB124-2]
MTLSPDQTALVVEATRLIDSVPVNLNHTVGAALVTSSGRVISALNMSHYSGGPCAEMVCLAKAADQGVLSPRVFAQPSADGLIYDTNSNGPEREAVVCIVAVADRGRGVLSPCGRCRQILLDYWPGVQVIMQTEDGSELETVPLQDLMPRAYRWRQRDKSVQP